LIAYPARHYALTKQEASEKNLSSGFGVKLRSFTAIIAVSAVRMFPLVRIALTFSQENIFSPKSYADISSAMTISHRPPGGV